MKKEIKHPFEGSTDIAISSPLEALFGQYQQALEQITEITDYVNAAKTSVMQYFFDGAYINHRTGCYTVSTFFNFENAKAALDADFWSKAISLTDVLEAMPAKERGEWREQISNHKTPAFERETVHATINDLLMKRAEFFAKRIDGIFQNLSREHVTNRPEGFSKRMIINYVFDDRHSLNVNMADVIHDFRVVIGKFMGREVPGHYITRRSLERLFDLGLQGKWQIMDGGAWKVKVFKCGTAHIECHPMMAYRLNQVLAQLYPMAIPATFRQKPVRYKQHPIEMELLPANVIEILSDIRFERGTETCFYEPVKAEPQTIALFERLNGRQITKGIWSFDYPIREVIDEIIRSGQVPEVKSHQFYQTPEGLAKQVVDMAEIQDEDRVLEPSAGLGRIADFLPKEQTLCVDIARLHARVLKSKGFTVRLEDFIKMDETEKFDKIVLNPPFSNGRCMEHLKKAAAMLSSKGKIVAIVPGSFKGKTVVDGWKHVWEDVPPGQFLESGTGVNVGILSLQPVH